MKAILVIIFTAMSGMAHASNYKCSATQTDTAKNKTILAQDVGVTKEDALKLYKGAGKSGVYIRIADFKDNDLMNGNIEVLVYFVKDVTGVTEDDLQSGGENVSFLAASTTKDSKVFQALASVNTFTSEENLLHLICEKQ
jgi:hypothetical protein